MLFSPIGAFLAACSRKKNRNIKLPDGYVTDQRGEPVRRMRYGFAHMDYNGCEVIAVYNALRTLGAPMPLWETAECFSRTFALWLFGIFGTRPRAIPAFFRKRGFRVTVYKRGAYEKAAGETALIYTYWNPHFRGIHTVELHRTAGGYVVLNYRPLAKRRFDSPAALCGAIPTAGAIQLAGIKR